LVLGRGLTGQGWDATSDKWAAAKAREEGLQGYIKQLQAHINEEKAKKIPELANHLQSNNIYANLIESQFKGIENNPRVKSFRLGLIKSNILSLNPNMTDSQKKDLNSVFESLPTDGRGGQWGNGESWYKQNQATALQSANIPEKTLDVLMQLLQSSKGIETKMQKDNPEGKPIVLKF
jgi:hypothetical protein